LKKKILYTYPGLVSFVRNDLKLLSDFYTVRQFGFIPKKKIFTPLYFIKQLFFILINLPGTSIFICQFAGYHSLLPVLFGKLFNIPVLLVLGGTDCVSFPSINYGNFNKPLLGWFTYRSLKYATHLAPVHESLVISNYTYTDDDTLKQGYQFFHSDIKTQHTTLCYGYDPEKFVSSEHKKTNSFITVAQLNAPNYYRKGIDLIFEMGKRFPECFFTIVGNTAEMKYDFVPPNVTLLPFIPYEELKNAYGSHEFYFQLSICEGFPSAPCEAMLCGCIPIVSNVAALPEIVGDAGFILPKKDPDLLEQLLKKALSSDKTTLSIKARQRIIDKYPINERQKFIELVGRLAKQ